MQRSRFMAFLTFVAAWSLVVSGAPDTIHVDGGTITGVVADGVASYKGIPYAAAPTGEWRWKPPQPVKPWDGVKAAATFGARCMQTPYPAGSIYTMDPAPQSEDCLFLNVWTAGKRGDTRPVMVWIHGGAFTRGASDIPTYDGTALAKKGVVLVSINYRLGAFGFFAHPELTVESPQHASGNYAILDMIAALRWVQKNIAAFGGDRSRVTIFGESAGSWAVNVLHATPLAKGLFQRAIGESGGQFGGTAALKAAEENGARIATSLGADSLAALRAVPADKLAAAQTSIAGVNVDGWVLPQSVRAIFAAHAQNDAPIVVGSNANEMTTLTSAATLPKTLDAFRARIASQYGESAKEFEAVYSVKAESDIPAALLGASRDTTFTLEMRTWARMNSTGDGKGAYLYQFTRVPPLNLPMPLGAYHAAEIVYAFNNVSSRPWVQPVDRTLADQMSSYWVNFATTGDPNGKGLPKWTRYDETGEPYLDLGDTIQTRNHLLKAQLDFLENVRARRQ